MKLNGLVLAGGLSQRMGSEKALLEIDGQTLAERSCQLISEFVDKVFLSVRPEQTTRMKLTAEILEDKQKNIGPAAALLAAYERDDRASWLVLACDFLMVNSSDIAFLVGQHLKSRNQVVCYKNSENLPEPLFAIWQPEALHKLKIEVGKQNFGPRYVLNLVKTLQIDPINKNCLYGANTLEEFSLALRILAETRRK